MSGPLLILEHEPIATLDEGDLDVVAEQVAKQNDKAMPEIVPETMTGRRFGLPFYEDVTLLELRDPSWRPQSARLYFLEHGDALVRLDGTSPPIHKVNSTAEIIISAQTVLSYIAFFCFFVRGEDGPFLIVDRLENRFLPALSNMAALQDQFREAKNWGQMPNGDWRASALVYYSNAAFLSDFVVSPDGKIQMEDDNPVLADLEAKIVAPLSVEAAKSH